MRERGFGTGRDESSKPVLFSSSSRKRIDRKVKIYNEASKTIIITIIIITASID